MTTNETMYPAPVRPRSVKNSTVRMPPTRPPTAIQGLNLPKRERVLSTRKPMTGSLKASNMRRAVKMPPIHSIVESGRFRISVMYTIKYRLTSE
jgi:hypothetical protein